VSFYRANVQWQSANGTWGMGFFTVSEEDGESETGVVYDYDSFEFATTGHATEHSAWDAATADRVNPGSSRIYRLSEYPQDCARFDTMAAFCSDHQRFGTPPENERPVRMSSSGPRTFTVSARRVGDKITGNVAPYDVDLSGCERRGAAAWDASERAVYIKVTAENGSAAVNQAYASEDFKALIEAKLTN
jgi:hypothetical protein